MAWERVQKGFDVKLSEFEMHGSKRQRPAAVRGFVSESSTTRTIDVPLAAITLAGADERVAHTEAGHLIALELGGADASQNLVPMYGNVNRGTYRALESKIAERISGMRKPAVLVEVSYPPPFTLFDAVDHRIPKQMDVYLFNEVDDLAKLSATAFARIGSVPNFREEPAHMKIEGSDIALRERLMKIRNDFPSKGWKVERQFPEWADKLPPLDQRPNAWLDYLIYDNDELKIAKKLLSKVAQGLFTIGPGWTFADVQRDFVVLAHRMTQSDEHKGECWSDADDDPIGTALTSLGTDDGIHIDHIFPMASGGPNIYSNAAVVSAKFNKEKGRKRSHGKQSARNKDAMSD